MPDLLIRQATIDDAPALYEMYKDKADAEGLAGRFSVTVQETKAQLERAVSIIVIATIGTELAGFANYHFEDSTFTGRSILAVKDLYTVPQHGGKGVAKNLLKYMANVAVQKGFIMGIGPLTSNVRPMAWYKKLGAKQAYDIHWLEVSDPKQFIQNLEI